MGIRSYWLQSGWAIRREFFYLLAFAADQLSEKAVRRVAHTLNAFAFFLESGSQCTSADVEAAILASFRSAGLHGRCFVMHVLSCARSLSCRDEGQYCGCFKPHDESWHTLIAWAFSFKITKHHSSCTAWSRVGKMSRRTYVGIMLTGRRLK